MAQAIPRNPAASLLATDGRPHPLQSTLVVVTGILGAIAVFAAFFHNLHLLGSWAGLAGILTGASGMYVSVTTRERFLVIIGLGASAVGFFIAMAHGGLFGGVVGG
jgi:hypothetical protein